MKITVLGAGYVGLVAGTCLAELGNDVICADIDKEKIKKLKRGILPIYEPGLRELVEINAKQGRLKFTADIMEGVEKSDVIYIAVGTPEGKDGKADMRYVYSAAESIGRCQNGYKIVVDKSTVPVGTAAKIKEILVKNQKKKYDFDVVSNPEFLREGEAVKDFMNPDRIIIGADSEKARKTMENIYRGIARADKPIFFTDTKSAELIKYASNAMLAARISFMNQLAPLCEKLGADIKMVAKGMGLDERIGPRFLQAGAGYGGSCLLGDELIIIKDENIIRPVKISSLFGTKIRKLEIASFDQKTKKICFSKIKSVSMRKYKGNIMTVTTRMNKTINATEDHPFLVYESGSFKIKLGRELSLKDRMPSFTSLPSSKGMKTLYINLLETIDTRSFNFAKIRVRPISASFKLTKFRNYLIGKLKPARLRDVLRSNCMTLKEYLDNNIELMVPRKNIFLFTSRGRTTHIPAIIELTPNFMRLLGYYISEGNISYDKSERGERARVTIHFNEEEHEYIRDLKKIYDSFGIKYSVISKKGNHTVSISVSSKLFARLLLHLGCGKDSYTADIPDFIFSSNKKCKFEFLKALFRGDGHVAFPKNTNSIVYDFGSISYNVVHKSILLFLSFGIVPSYKTSRSKKSTDFAHFFRISTKNQIEQLPMFKDAKTQLKINNVLSNCKDIKSVGFTRLNSEVCLTEVVSLSKEYSETDVYSIEVKNTGTFISSHGLIVHNCFPKDVMALMQVMKDNDIPYEIIKAVDDVNERQKRSIVPKLKKYIPDLKGKKIALWGLAFKPKTDDMRDAPSITIIKQLLDNGAKVKAFDPVAQENAKKIFPKIEFSRNPYDAIAGCDALVIVTEWDEFRDLDKQKIKAILKQPIIIDGRNIYEPKEMAELGFKYTGIGRGDSN